VLIAPVPGPPHILIPTAIISAIGALWNLFKGGVSESVKRALEGLRGAIAGVADTLMRFGWQISRALGKVLSALHTIWTRVIWPVLRNLPRALGRLRRLIERDLPRLLRYIQRIRDRLLLIYEHYMRPLLVTIQRLRRLLLILRLFHVKWAGKLDAQLARLQARIMQPLTVILSHLGIVERWLNLLLNTRYYVKGTIWKRSLWAHQGDLVNTWWYAQGAFPGAFPAVAPPSVPSPYAAGQVRQTFELWCDHEAGPLADDVARVSALLDQELVRGGAV